MEKWDNNIEEILGYSSLQDYICDNFSIRRLTALAQNEKNINHQFVEPTNASRIYCRFSAEIEQLAPRGSETNNPAPEPDAARARRVNLGIFGVAKELFEQNKKLFAQHPDKNISVVFNTDIAWLWQRTEIDFEAFASMTDYVKNLYAGRDLVGACCVTEPVIAPARALLVYQAFAGEINSLNLYHQFKNSVQTADNLIFKIVNAALRQIHGKLYEDYSTDLIQHPHKPVIDLKKNPAVKEQAGERGAE